MEFGGRLCHSGAGRFLAVRRTHTQVDSGRRGAPLLGDGLWRGTRTRVRALSPGGAPRPRRRVLAPRFRVLRAALTRRRNRPAADGPAASPWARKQRLVAAGTSRQDAARSWPPGAASSKGSELRPPGRRQRSPVSMASVTHGPNAKWKAPETNNTYALTPF